jgi:hypothetical protein
MGCHSPASLHVSPVGDSPPQLKQSLRDTSLRASTRWQLPENLYTYQPCLGHDHKPDSQSPQAHCAQSLCMLPLTCMHQHRATNMHQHAGQNAARLHRSRCPVTAQRVMRFCPAQPAQGPKDIHPRGKKNCRLRIPAISHVWGHDPPPDSQPPQACDAESLRTMPQACTALDATCMQCTTPHTCALC